MLLSGETPQVVREYRVEPGRADDVAGAAVATVKALWEREAGCRQWAVHRAHDHRRVITLEAWSTDRAYRRSGHLGVPAGEAPVSALYRRVGVGGPDPTPITDPAAGVTVIDTFPVWRGLTRPVAAFNVRNGRAFHDQPGCVSTTVLRARTAGRIATYARWHTIDDFLAAFLVVQGAAVDSLDAINTEVGRMTHGLLRTDYHAYDLVDASTSGTVRGAP